MNTQDTNTQNEQQTERPALTEAQQKKLVDGMNKLNAKRTVALKKAGA